MGRKKGNNECCLLVIAGGQGTRLWPISHKDCPKQFTPIGHNESFIQATVKRYYEVGVQPKHVFVVTTNTRQRELAVEQLRGLGVLEPNIITFPSSYGYAGSMLKGGEFIDGIYPNSCIINSPADQYIDMKNESSREDFLGTMNAAIASANTGNPTIVGLKGIKREAFSGLGHAQYNPNEKGRYRKVSDFIEKPQDGVMIAAMIRSDDTAANTGINVWRMKDIREATIDVDFEHGEVATDALMNMLKATGKLRMVIGRFGWEDCGTLRALLNITPKTGRHHNNAILGRGNIVAERSNCRNTLLYTVEGIEVYGHNLRDVAVVVNTIGEITYVVVVSHEYAQDVRSLAEYFDTENDCAKNSRELYGENNIVIPTNISQEFKVGFIGVSGCYVSTTKTEHKLRVENGIDILEPGRTIVQVSM